MAQLGLLRCPRCGLESVPIQLDGQSLLCVGCQSRFPSAVDRSSGKTSLTASEDLAGPEPLFLPRGSIRALVTLGMSYTVWRLAQRGLHVPQNILTLVLTMTGYYFAMRRAGAAAPARTLDAGAQTPQPLFLPPGLIRNVLVGGFALTAYLLWRQGRLVQPAFLEFFSIFAGLVTGYLFNKALSKQSSPRTLTAVGHAKGLAVLAAAFWLSALLLGSPQAANPLLLLALPGVISFYFGSR